MIRRLRLACPNVPLILLTAHGGKGFLKRAVAANLSAIIHQRDSVAVFLAALEAVQSGRGHQSALIAFGKK